MTVQKLRAILPPCLSLEIEIVKSAYCPNDSYYFMQDLNEKVKAHLETVHGLKNRAMIAELRYDNVLKGLKYWKARVGE